MVFYIWWGGGGPRNHTLCMIDLYSHTLCIVTENINTTYTQIIKYMCWNKVTFLTRRRDFHSYYFDTFTHFF
jgi:hypothetical protein